MEIVFYGKNKRPVYEFISALSSADQAKVIACLKNIEDLGFDCPRVDFRQIDGKLWEIKIRGISGGFRIFYITLKGNKLVLLHAYQKKSQKAPSKEIEVAKKRMIEVMKDETFYTK